MEVRQEASADQADPGAQEDLADPVGRAPRVIQDNLPVLEVLLVRRGLKTLFRWRLVIQSLWINFCADGGDILGIDGQ